MVLDLPGPETLKKQLVFYCKNEGTLSATKSASQWERASWLASGWSLAGWTSPRDTVKRYG